MTTTQLIDKCKELALRPANDQRISRAGWASLLSTAHDHWLGIIAGKVPESQRGAPVALTVSADGKTAAFPAGVEPGGRVILMDGLAGRVLTPGDYGDPGGDFALEVSQDGTYRVRAPMDRTFSFGAGLYARYVDLAPITLREYDAGPPVVEAVNPRLQPANTHMLLVYHALALYASSGNYMDPAYWEHMEIKHAWDDPEFGKIGVVTQMMNQFQDQGADSEGDYIWYRSPDLGNLRHRLV